jgi:hypothetical protein
MPAICQPSALDRRLERGLVLYELGRLDQAIAEHRTEEADIAAWAEALDQLDDLAESLEEPGEPLLVVPCGQCGPDCATCAATIEEQPGLGRFYRWTLGALADADPA